MHLRCTRALTWTWRGLGRTCLRQAEHLDSATERAPVARVWRWAAFEMAGSKTRTLRHKLSRPEQQRGRHDFCELVGTVTLALNALSVASDSPGGVTPCGFHVDTYGPTHAFSRDTEIATPAPPVLLLTGLRSGGRRPRPHQHQGRPTAHWQPLHSKLHSRLAEARLTQQRHCRYRTLALPQ